MLILIDLDFIILQKMRVNVSKIKLWQNASLKWMPRTMCGWVEEEESESTDRTNVLANRVFRRANISSSGTLVNVNAK